MPVTSSPGTDRVGVFLLAYARPVETGVYRNALLKRHSGGFCQLLQIIVVHGRQEKNRREKVSGQKNNRGEECLKADADLAERRRCHSL